ncbi:hypothetical protein M0R45_037741 [Rubus argutus]|uniref:Leucine-rich repeat-containing N-terminal plant-type domain-containing protein n=1 Tax=Rubus argutus TaxID=59490 RepID=A0AAW1W4G1_RUBAR
MSTILLLVRFLTVATITISFGLCCNGNLGVPPCKESEKQALLKFKHDLKDPAHRLLSWRAGEGDCCNWTGVVCDNITGHVLELHLSLDFWLSQVSQPPEYSWFNPFLGGKINPSLLNLKHLNYLDLSNNRFEGIQIPTFFGSLKSLRYLDLSDSGFEGTIPHQLGNISSLRHLSLSNNDGLKVENLEWISGLSQLEHLDMSSLNLSKASNNWLQVTNKLPSLVELHLSFCGLDNIPSLLATNFTSFAILDLSGNHFHSLMPRWVFSLRNLASLDLSSCGFQGLIPSSPHNITSLREIDLSWNDLGLPIPEWLFNHKDLTNLSLGGNQFGGPFPGGIANMTGLKSLHLESNNFHSSIPKWFYSLKLIDLDLSKNTFSGNVSEFFERSHQIESLSLGNNNFSGHLTEQIGKCKNLYSLDVSYNSISGPIPVSLGNMSSVLQKLVISHNQFNGTLPETIGQLKMLTELDISYNSLEGVVSEVHFAHLASLDSFIANANLCTLKTRRDWLPRFQLQELDLNSWHLGPEFPIWLQTQTKLSLLSLSNTGISATIPTWFWNIFSQLHYINLSHNQLYGEIQNTVQGSVVDLSFNQFNGSLPLVSSAVDILDLSNSYFSGSVFRFFCDKMDTPKGLSFLFLGNNLLSGNIPDCLMNWPTLEVLDLENNNFTGTIPSSMESLINLRSLHLRNNRLSGELPSSLLYARDMSVLDLGENKFVGSLSAMKIADGFSSLVVLNLRSNKLQGHIPRELCGLRNLQILDLAGNNLSGTIPRCFNRFSAMATLSQLRSSIELIGFSIGNLDVESFLDKTPVVTKGIEYVYDKNLGLMTSIDLSANAISGEIPEELTDLIGLRALNLSENLLTGRIPSQIGNMGQLESIDLSMNRLHGEIPASMTRMTSLSHLNLSHNNLTGRIPKSTQLQSLDPSSFVGNELCGPPLSKNCSESKVNPPTATVEQHRGYDLFEDGWLYLSLGLGFMFGFWSILGSLLFNMPWSLAFSRFQNSIVLKLHAVIVDYF